MGKDNLKIHTFFGKKFPRSRAYFRPVSRFSWILPIYGSHKVGGGCSGPNIYRCDRVIQYLVNSA